MLKFKATEVEVVGRQFKAVLNYNKLQLKVHGSFIVIYKENTIDILLNRDNIKGLKSILNDVDFSDLAEVIAFEVEAYGDSDVE